MELTTYQTLAEKDLYFQTGSVLVDDETSFNFIWDHVRSIDYGKFIYRGVNEARYKLYNSAQRDFLSNDYHNVFTSYKHYILNLISTCKNWENGRIPQLLKSVGIDEDNYLSYLSALQHSGLPSPLLDFSYDPLVALFFSFYHSSHSGAKVIDQYVSLYLIDVGSSIYFIDFDRMALNAIALRNIVNNEQNELSLDNHIPFNLLFEVPNLLIDVTKNNSFKTINTMNIIYQNGVLLFTSKPDLPLEDISVQRFEKTNTDWREIKCFNFNKSLKNYALSRLEQEGYTYRSLFYS